MTAPLISIVIPVLNEAGLINEAIAHLLHLNHSSGIEIIVVDGDVRGSTIDAISDVAVKRAVSEKKGRGDQMNLGAKMAQGDILLFLHADTLLEPDALDRIRDAFSRPDVAGGAFGFKIRSGRRVYRLIEFGAALRFWFTRIPYGDQAIFLNRKFFLEQGGYRSIPIMEEVELMKRVKKTGKKMAFIDANAHTSSRRWDREGALYCTLRNWSLILLFQVGVSPDKLARFYRFS